MVGEDYTPTESFRTLLGAECASYTAATSGREVWRVHDGDGDGLNKVPRKARGLRRAESNGLMAWWRGLYPCLIGHVGSAGRQVD